MQLQFAGKGAAARNKDGTPGNLVIEVEVERHPIFKRQKYDVHIDRTVDFTDAVLGSVLRRAAHLPFLAAVLGIII